MSGNTYQPRGLYFEEFQIGQEFITMGRTVTESDIVTFAGFSADYNQIHTDAEYSKQTYFKQRVAHGLLVLSIASGLIAQSGFIEGTVLAFREINNWKFAAPTFIGDTVHAVCEIVETKALPRLGGGSVVLKISVVKQTDEIVMKGKWTALMVSKPS
jgi:acyl dehydratase